MAKPKHIYDLLQQYREKFPYKRDALADKVGGIWIKYSTDDYIQHVENFTLGLVQYGIEPGDKIATIVRNCPQWNIMDMAIGSIGAVHVALYNTLTDDEYTYILENCEAKIIIVSGQEMYNRIYALRYKLEQLPTILTIEEYPDIRSWKDLLISASDAEQELTNLVKNMRANVTPENVLTIIYTSGTTGKPKGVMLTHSNILSNIEATYKLLPINHQHRAISFLPISHVLERMVNYLFQYMGVSIYYAESIEKLSDNIREVQPAVFVTVPRVIERVYDRIIDKAMGLSYIKRLIFNHSVKIADNYSDTFEQSFFYKWKLKWANNLVFVKWREALGGNLQIIIVGGAALQPRLARIFWAAGIKVAEGYGLTETSPVIAVNHETRGEYKFGTVGMVVDNVDVKLAEDGEILMKGPSLMKGYYKDTKRTKEVIDADGWFHTGDIGEWVDNKFLKIIDRKSEMFKLSTGFYVAPQHLENLLKESPYIQQAMIVGARQKYTGALIVPEFDALRAWAHEHGMENMHPLELTLHHNVHLLYSDYIRRVNRKISKTQNIVKFKILHEEWTPQTGELSPTLKLKRNHLMVKFERQINEMFQEE